MAVKQIVIVEGDDPVLVLVRRRCLWENLIRELRQRATRRFLTSPQHVRDEMRQMIQPVVGRHRTLAPPRMDGVNELEVTELPDDGLLESKLIKGSQVLPASANLLDGFIYPMWLTNVQRQDAPREVAIEGSLPIGLATSRPRRAERRPSPSNEESPNRLPI